METQDLLSEQEYFKETEKRSTVFKIFVFICIMYLAFIFYEVVMKENINQTEEVLAFAVVFGLPLTGLLLFYFIKKAGWIISSLFFMFLLSFAVIQTIREIIYNKPLLDYQKIYLTTISTAASVLLSSKKIRDQFRIRPVVYFLTAGISLSFTAMLIYIVNR